MQLTHWLIPASADLTQQTELSRTTGASHIKRPPALVHATTHDQWTPNQNDMLEGDARQLSPAAIHRLRNEVARRHVLGQTRTEISIACRLSYSSVSKIIKRYEQGGEAALAPKLRGRKIDEKRRLTLEQEQHIHQIIVGSREPPTGTGAGLWNRASVSELLSQEFGLILPNRTMDNYLKRWGFKPTAKVFTSARKEHPCQAILARANADHMSVLWVHFSNVDCQKFTVTRAQTEAPKRGIFAVNNRGEACWMVTNDSAHLTYLIQYCESVRVASRGKLLLLIAMTDFRLRPEFEQWLVQNGDSIECYYLPEMQLAVSQAGQRSGS